MTLDAYKARIDLILNDTASWAEAQRQQLLSRFLVKRGHSLAEIDRSPFRSVSASETACSRHVSLDSCYGCGGAIEAGLSASGSVRCHDCRAAA